jgi:DNA ligase (NAD+)
MATKKQRIKELEDQILYHNHRYHELNNPEISDSEFDEMVAELKYLDSESFVLYEVGAAVSHGKEVKHSQVMGSLEKAHSADEVREWAKSFPDNTEFVIALKIDGGALKLQWDDCKLELAATRGNGEVGQDVTDNVRMMSCIPNVIAFDEPVEVRGEYYMTTDTFDRLNEEGSSFANTRNAACGSIGTKDPRETRDRDLAFFAYDLKMGSQTFETEIEKRNFFIDNFDMDYVQMVPMTMDMLDMALDAATRNRPGLPYRIDGMVISVNNLEMSAAAGVKSGKYPNGKIAFKFPAERAQTRLIGIHWQVGRTGVITPVADLEPVFLDGSTVTSPTLHNIMQIRQKGIGIGCTVEIEKAGDIIPQVIKVTEPATVDGLDSNINYPHDCPSCGDPTVEDEGKSNIWCVNPMCPAQLSKKIENWLTVLDIKGVGEKTVEALVEKGIVNSIPDMYHLAKDDLVEIKGGERAAEVILEAMESKNSIPLKTFLQALGISWLGKTRSRDIAKEYKTLDAVLNKTAEDFLLIDGIGDIKATTLMSLQNCVN